MARFRTVARWLLAIAMVGVGVTHFTDPATFVRIVPPWLPWPLALVYVSGVAEVLGGLGLLPERTRSAAGWGLIALYIAVFPANVHMALNDIPFGDAPANPVVLWGRLPFQVLFIAWAYWVSRPEKPAEKPTDEPAQRG
jgi:uncharacterized membrane protein